MRKQFRWNGNDPPLGRRGCRGPDDSLVRPRPFPPSQHFFDTLFVSSLTSRAPELGVSSLTFSHVSCEYFNGSLSLSRLKQLIKSNKALHTRLFRSSDLARVLVFHAVLRVLLVNYFYGGYWEGDWNKG